MFADVWRCHGVTASASLSPHEHAHNCLTMIVRRGGEKDVAGDELSGGKDSRGRRVGFEARSTVPVTLTLQRDDDNNSGDGDGDDDGDDTVMGMMHAAERESTVPRRRW